jgi:hypothetical protein
MPAWLGASLISRTDRGADHAKFNADFRKVRSGERNSPFQVGGFNPAELAHSSM